VVENWRKFALLVLVEELLRSFGNRISFEQVKA
jgi:hypothetical protein